MRRQFKRPKIVLGLLVTLALSVVMVVPASAAPTFTGYVETDFPDTNPTILIFADPGGKDVLLNTITVPPLPPDPLKSSGWDIKDVRVTYDSGTDILYVGLNSYETVGDADSDGFEGAKSYGAGVDMPNLGFGEVVTVYFDLDQDGNWDVIAGVPDAADFSGFTVKSALGTTAAQAFFGATNLTAAHLGTRYWNPASAPDLEFEIENFSLLPGQGGQLSAFTIGAFMGSQPDIDIIEDVMIGSNGPAAINIVKKTNDTDNNSPTGPYIAVGGTVTWTYNVTNPGSVNLTNIVVTDDNGTPGSQLDDWSPAYVSGDDGDDILQTTEAWIYEASGNASLGQYGNNATVTGDFDGFTVSDADPDHYRGVDARISIQESDTNPVNTAHNFTVTVEMNDGDGWDPAVGVNVTPWLLVSSVGSITSAPPYTTDGLGQVIVTVNSAVAGTATLHASATVNVGGVNIAVATNGYGAYIVDNEKTWEAGACIHIEKSTNGEDADDPEGPHIALGGNVTWEYVVTNCGNVPVGNITVTDDQGVIPIPVDLDEDGFIDGDINKDGLLDLTETWIYRASGNATVGQYANIATVVGYYGIVLLTDSDPSHYFGLGPAIHIEKHTNGVDADDPPGPNISINSTVTWTYIVTNTGAVNLTGIVVTDNKPGVTPTYVSGDTSNFGVLDLTEIWIYQATGVAVAGQYANIGTVVGYYDAVQVTDTDPSHYYNRPAVGWETYPINKVRVLLPWIALLTAIIVGASLLVLRRRRAQS